MVHYMCDCYTFEICPLFQKYNIIDTSGTLNSIECLKLEDVQGGARNVILLIVHITHFYFYKSI